jgi:hypothetical protein
MHTDRGLVFVHDEADGTTSLSICAKVINGEPTDVYARYNHAPQVQIAPDVAFTSNGRSRHTTEIVEVASRDGLVTVRYPKYSG